MAMQKISKGLVVAIALVGMILVVTTAGLLTVNRNVPSQGQITTVNVAVYSDSACTTTLSIIDWGTVSPGKSVAKTVYVKNTGNVQISLGLANNTWVPAEAAGPIAIVWDKEGSLLASDASTPAVITLSVSSSITGITNFSVNLVISGTG